MLYCAPLLPPPPCHCIVGCSENLCWTMTLIQTTSVALLCLPVHPEIATIASPLSPPPLISGFPGSQSNLVNSRVAIILSDFVTVFKWET